MRLLYYQEDLLCVTEDLRNDIPRYAILSHRWETPTEEVTLADVLNGKGQDKIGYFKLKFCGNQAKNDGLSHFWVDTCCIDKTNPQEIGRAIASMYQWYAKAAKCYVYLSDLERESITNLDALCRSQWFTRGWTLQELLAPREVTFFSRDGHQFGSREDLREQIHMVTGIDKRALDGELLGLFSEAERFAWAAQRITSEPEDEAYCLLGIFGVSMQPHYGEGRDAAFVRLKESMILKYRNDLTQLDVKQCRVAASISNDESPIWPTHIRSSQARFPTATVSTEPASHSSITSLTDALESGVWLRPAKLEEIEACIKYYPTNNQYWNVIANHYQVVSKRLGEGEYLSTWVAQRQKKNSTLWIVGSNSRIRSNAMVDIAIILPLYHPRDRETRHSSKYWREEMTVITHYCNEASDTGENVDDVYRSLASQLIHVFLRRSRCESRYNLPDAFHFNPDEFDSPPEGKLQELLNVLVSMIGRRDIYCLIDGMDYKRDHGNQYKKAIRFLQGLGTKARFHTCFTQSSSVGLTSGAHSHIMDLDSFEELHFSRSMG